MDSCQISNIQSFPRSDTLAPTGWHKIKFSRDDLWGYSILEIYKEIADCYKDIVFFPPEGGKSNFKPTSKSHNSRHSWLSGLFEVVKVSFVSTIQQISKLTDDQSNRTKLLVIKTKQFLFTALKTALRHHEMLNSFSFFSHWIPRETILLENIGEVLHNTGCLKLVFVSANQCKN